MKLANEIREALAGEGYITGFLDASDEEHINAIIAAKLEPVKDAIQFAVEAQELWHPLGAVELQHAGEATVLAVMHSRLVEALAKLSEDN